MLHIFTDGIGGGVYKDVEISNSTTMTMWQMWTFNIWNALLGPVWLDQNWIRFQNPLRLFRPDFLKPNPDSWNHETSPRAGFIGFKMADGDGPVSVESSDSLF